jgi:hypothetical protein
LPAFHAGAADVVAEAVIGEESEAEGREQ